MHASLCPMCMNIHMYMHGSMCACLGSFGNQMKHRHDGTLLRETRKESQEERRGFRSLSSSRRERSGFLTSALKVSMETFSSYWLAFCESVCGWGGGEGVIEPLPDHQSSVLPFSHSGHFLICPLQNLTLGSFYVGSW